MGMQTAPTEKKRLNKLTSSSTRGYSLTNLTKSIAKFPLQVQIPSLLRLLQ